MVGFNKLKSFCMMKNVIRKRVIRCKTCLRNLLNFYAQHALRISRRKLSPRPKLLSLIVLLPLLADCVAAITGGMAEAEMQQLVTYT